MMLVNASSTQRFTKDRLFPADPAVRAIARELYRRRARSAHHQPARSHRSGLVRAQRAVPATRLGCCWLRTTICSACLYSQGVALADLTVVPPRPQAEGRSARGLADFRRATSTFSTGTPSWLWLNHVCLRSVFGLEVALEAEQRRPLFRCDRCSARDARSFVRARCSSASASRCWRTTESPTDSPRAPSRASRE